MRARKCHMDRTRDITQTPHGQNQAFHELQIYGTKESMHLHIYRTREISQTPHVQDQWEHAPPHVQNLRDQANFTGTEPWKPCKLHIYRTSESMHLHVYRTREILQTPHVQNLANYVNSKCTKSRRVCKLHISTQTPRKTRLTPNVWNQGEDFTSTCTKPGKSCKLHMYRTSESTDHHIYRTREIRQTPACTAHIPEGVRPRYLVPEPLQYFSMWKGQFIHSNQHRHWRVLKSFAPNTMKAGRLISSHGNKAHVSFYKHKHFHMSIWLAIVCLPTE